MLLPWKIPAADQEQDLRQTCLPEVLSVWIRWFVGHAIAYLAPKFGTNILRYNWECRDNRKISKPSLRCQAIKIHSRHLNFSPRCSVCKCIQHIEAFTRKEADHFWACSSDYSTQYELRLHFHSITNVASHIGVIVYSLGSPDTALIVYIPEPLKFLVCKLNGQ